VSRGELRGAPKAGGAHVEGSGTNLRSLAGPMRGRRAPSTSNPLASTSRGEDVAATLGLVRQEREGPQTNAAI
jgi:hypothetical protein